MNITFIGLGIMGREMVANLLKKHQNITVYNRTIEKAQDLTTLGAKVSDNISQAVAEADLVISMLSDPKAVAAVFLNKDAALTKMKPNATWMDCSTVDPGFSRRCGEVSNKYGLDFIDAPVAGSKPQAAAAVLSFFVGTTAEKIQPFEEILLSMGQKVIPFNEVGQGSAFKMVVNMLLGQSMIVFSEALQLGSALGIDQEFLLNTLPKLPVTAPFTALKTDNIRTESYEPHFPLELMLKDMRLATQSFENNGKRLPLAESAKALYEQANEAGLGRADFSAIHEYLT